MGDPWQSRASGRAVPGNPIPGVRGGLKGPSNVAYTIQDWYPLGYLAGVVAALSTRSGTVGFIGGLEIAATNEAREGYEAGVKATDPKVAVRTTITGSFTDAAKGKSATQAQIASGVDVVYSFLDAAHDGAVQAAKPRGVRLIGVVSPKCDFSAGLLIGGTLADQQQLVFTLVKQMVEGKSENVVHGLRDPSVARFEFCPGQEDPKIASAVRRAVAAFNSGQLTSAHGS